MIFLQCTTRLPHRPWCHKNFIFTPVTQICTIYPEFLRISVGMKSNICIYCKWYFCVSYEREICAFMTTCSNCHWNLHLARTCHTIKNVTFCSESGFFFVVPVNKYRISCKLAYNLIDICKFLTKEDFSFRFYTYYAKINDLIANVMVSP
jgi:hypothetical protein